LIKTSTEYQQQVMTLQKEKEEFEQQCNLATKEIQKTQEKMGIALVT
jgi:hypothetical protein